MYVTHRFELAQYTKDLIRDMEPDFGYDGFGEFVFYRTYSRSDNGYQENWADVVIRVIQGTMTIRKDWYIKNHVSWRENFWQTYARKMAIAMHKMEWLPPGRGLWAAGTEFVYERGGMALQNCGYTWILDSLEKDLAWMMDALMLGVGIGFSPIRNDNFRLEARSSSVFDFEIPDTREGWVESIYHLIKALRVGSPIPRMIYDKIREAGLPIRGFGGISSGPEPLEELHERIEDLMERFRDDPYYDTVMLKTDLANIIGDCVVAGNVRRSAELASLTITDPTFKSLKDYENEKFAYRTDWGYMSNNSVSLTNDSDFELLSEVAKRVIERGEPGIHNLQNFPLGRVGKKDNIRKDYGTGTNPCQPYWAPVLTKSGITKFGDLQIGTEIWSEQGWTKVTNKISTGIKKVYKYTTTAGIFYGTEDHRVVCCGYKITASEASGIDVLTGPYSDKWVERNPQDIMDGLITGDGEYCHGVMTLHIGEKDQDYWASIIRPLIGLDYNKPHQYKVQSRLEYLEKTYERTISDRYFYSDRDTICNFLRGLFSANGSICGDRVTLKASSFELIKQVQIMLSSIGIRSYHTTNKTKVIEFSNGKYQCKESYDLNISTDRDKFQNLIGFIQQYKNDKLIDTIHRIRLSTARYNTYEIISSELISEEEVFDITVEQGKHTYWTSGVNVSNCGEQIQEGGWDIFYSKKRVREVCNISESLPTRCDDHETWLKACEYATVYSSTVSLLPTHQPSTNRVVNRNRRIGISIIDYAGWKESLGVNQTTKWLRKGYKKVRRINQWVNSEAGIPESIRVTTIKPGGTVPKLAGRTSGIGHPTFDYTLRRVIVAKNSPLVPLLIEANIPYEDSVTDQYSYVFAYPIHQQGSKPAEKISLWEQAMNLVLIQREWSDNAVSNTLYFVPKWTLKKILKAPTKILTGIVTNGEVKFGTESYQAEPETVERMLKNHLANVMTNENEFYAAMTRINDENPDFIVGNYRIKSKFSDEIIEAKVFEFNPAHEEDSIEPVLSAIAPLTKSVSLLPHTPAGVYEQMPESGLSEAEYHQLKAQIKKVDWSKLSGSMGQDERYCQGPQCEIPIKSF